MNIIVKYKSFFGQVHVATFLASYTWPQLKDEFNTNKSETFV